MSSHYEHIIKPVADLIGYVNNARTHDPAQIAQICASISEWGFTNPILIDEKDGIIAGHGRLEAAQKLKMETVPCVILAGLTDAQRKGYILADNQLAMNAGWDLDLLKLELENLEELNFDTMLLGFDDDFLEGLLTPDATEGLTDPDDCPEPPEEPVTVIGDVWKLGKHKVMCGDSTSIDAVDKLMDGQKADMVFTDPPYNIGFKPQRGTHDIIKNDDMSDADFIQFLTDAFVCCKAVMHPDTYLISFMSWSTVGEFKTALKDLFTIKSMPIWKKNNFGIGYYTRPQYEPFYLCLNGDPIKPQKAPSDVFEFAKVHKTIHSCEKPVALIVGICDYFNKNGLFYEPFGGSGSMIMACETTNRKCNTMELDEKYVDVIIKRWQDFTGKDAVHIESGMTYTEMAQSKNIDIGEITASEK